MHTAIVLRAPLRTMGMIKLFVTYLQYLMLKLELFKEASLFLAYMTPQVCYLEKILQLHISPLARINTQAFDVYLFREDDPEGTDFFINDSTGQIFYTNQEFDLYEFTVIMPLTVVAKELYTRELLDLHKLAGKQYTIIYQ